MVISTSSMKRRSAFVLLMANVLCLQATERRFSPAYSELRVFNQRSLGPRGEGPSCLTRSVGVPKKIGRVPSSARRGGEAEEPIDGEPRGAVKPAQLQSQALAGLRETGVRG